MLAALFAPAVLSAIFEKGFDLFKDYQQGKITLEQLKTQLGVIAMQEATKVEQANTEMVAKTSPAFMDTLKTSQLVRVVYAVVTLSQAFVLFWYQWAVPFIVYKFGGSFPPASDVLLQWGYGLLVLLVGGGAVAIKRPQQPGPKP